jgi:thiol-disulfide isomerase/thioredoxin
MAEFKVNRIYIDIWAAWCGHCEAEFAYNEKLKEMLNSEGVEIFYISTDRDNDDE